jgi:hypothetical protein
MTSFMEIMAWDGSVMNVIGAMELPDEQAVHPLQNMIRKVSEDV